MIFYRYQNTKTLETNSMSYADMRLLYNKIIYERDFGNNNKDLTVEYCVEKFYPIFSEELLLRKGVDENICKEIIREISKIALKSELSNLSSSEKENQRKIAFKQIDYFMDNYPFDGIFVFPEYCDECKFGTKYSITEMRSKIVCSTSTPEVKFLASYSGEIIKKEMLLGGTLIKPKKILGVRTVFSGASRVDKDNKSSLSDIFYRDIDNNKKLEEVIESRKNFLNKYSDYFLESDVSRSIVKSHTRELLIRKALEISNSDYKSVDYRFKDDRHLIEITNKNKLYKFCIYNKDVTVDNLLNNDLIEYNGFYIEDDLFNNITNKMPLSLGLAM